MPTIIQHCCTELVSFVENRGLREALYQVSEKQRRHHIVPYINGVDGSFLLVFGTLQRTTIFHSELTFTRLDELDFTLEIAF